MQQTVVGDVGVTVPSCAPPLGAHEPPSGPAVDLIDSPMLPPPPMDAHVVGTRMSAIPAPLHLAARWALQATPVGAPQVQVVHLRPSFAPP